jgi:hypothetical protein
MSTDVTAPDEYHSMASMNDPASQSSSSAAGAVTATEGATTATTTTESHVLASHPEFNAAHSGTTDEEAEQGRVSLKGEQQEPERTVEGHDDLEAYRNSRRMSRNSSRPRRSDASESFRSVVQEPTVKTSTGIADSEPCDRNKGPAPLNAESSEKQATPKGPACLLSFTESVQSCTQSIQDWSVRQEAKAKKRREKVEAAEVIIEKDGTVIEPKGDSWMQRKLIIFFVLIILSWVYIVFVWRICVAAIRLESRALISRSQGSEWTR